MKNEKKEKHQKNEKKRKGFEKKRLLIISKVNFEKAKGENSQNEKKHEKKTEKKTKRVREKANFDNVQGQFQRRKHSQNDTKTKRVRDFDNFQGQFQGKGRTNNQNNTETKQNEKKGKGFEKKLLVAIPKDQGPFSKQRKESENAKGRKNRNEKTMKKINGDKKGMIIFNSK